VLLPDLEVVVDAALLDVPELAFVPELLLSFDCVETDLLLSLVVVLVLLDFASEPVRVLW